MAKKIVDIEDLPAPSELMPFNRRLRVPEQYRKPGYVQRLTRNTPEDIDFREAQGWRVVTVKSTEADQPDGRVIIAKYVLMEMPQELYEAYRKRHKKESARAMRGPEESFKGKAEDAGFEVVQKTRYSRGPMSQVLGQSDKDDD